MPVDLAPDSKVYQDQMTTVSHGLALSNPPLINHGSLQIRPYPSSTALQSNGSVRNASFMTSPSDDSFIEVRNYTVEIPHEDAFVEDTTNTTHDELPVIDNVIKAWRGGVSTSAGGSSIAWSTAATYDSGASPSRSQARAPRFHMHPLLSYTRLHHAPISYDVAFTPSARTVVDRTLHSPFPEIILAQPATEPPIPASSRLILRSPKLPWVVVVGTPSYFKTKNSAALTNLDVLYVVHSTLMTWVTLEEWDSLGELSQAQRRVAGAYKERCTRMGGGWEGGVRRVDWLGSKTHLVGVEIDKSNEADGNVGKLVFGRPPSRGGGAAASPTPAASTAKP